MIKTTLSLFDSTASVTARALEKVPREEAAVKAYFSSYPSDYGIGGRGNVPRL